MTRLLPIALFAALFCAGSPAQTQTTGSRFAKDVENLRGVKAMRVRVYLNDQKVDDPYFVPYLKNRMKEVGIAISDENPGLTLNVQRMKIDNSGQGITFGYMSVYCVDLDFNQTFVLGKDANGVVIRVGASSLSWGPEVGWAGSLRIDDAIKLQVATQMDGFIKLWREANP